MSFLKRPQITAIIVAVAAVVLLLLLPRSEEVESKPESIDEQVVSEDYKDVAIANLDDQEKQYVENIQSLVDKTEDPLQKIELLDSLSHFWDHKSDLLMSADQLYVIADLIQDKPSYFIAGDKYFEAFGELNDDTKTVALKKSIMCYEAILEDIPGDLEAKTSLGVCYVEGAALLGEAPMKGIGILREVLEQDPENINALINLGYFSTKSGQYEKAIERFELVIKIDPEFSDAYLYLSDVYLQMGNKEEAANYLEKFKEFIEDPAGKEEIEIYIENLRNNNI